MDLSPVWTSPLFPVWTPHLLGPLPCLDPPLSEPLPFLDPSPAWTPPLLGSLLCLALYLAWTPPMPGPLPHLGPSVLCTASLPLIYPLPCLNLHDLDLSLTWTLRCLDPSLDWNSPQSEPLQVNLDTVFRSESKFKPKKHRKKVFKC